MHFRRQRDILLNLQERKARLALARRLPGKDANSLPRQLPVNWVACLPGRDGP